MPTPVSTARQCLTPEAANALDEAVSVARRRGHGQTTSLHAVSALLSLPSSPLRDACARARNSAYSPRLQFKALDLCLSVSLDRVPSTQLADDPPVSNSLMAAIKRSQANQRRQPGNFHLYQQIQNQQSSISCVKVELQHLILSVLDDPIVSRVFAESGFRSSDIKLAILRPLPQLYKYSRTRTPPLFLCNLTENSNLTHRSFSFPFSGYCAVVNEDENCKRIGEVLVKSKGKNPLLVGVCAYDALRNFTENIQRRKYNIVPVELSGLNIISIENEVSRFITDNFDDGSMNSTFEEVGKMAEHSLGPGVVVNYGDLKTLTCDELSGDAAAYVVAQLTRLLEIYGGKLWLIGAVSTYEMYLKFLSRFPSIEKDWDSQLLPITSLKPPLAGPYSGSRSSLMESFVPFGGFFSTPSDLKSPLNGSFQSVSQPRCNLCNDKCELEVAAFSKGGSTGSVADQNQSSLPSWIHTTELRKNEGFDAEKAKDDGELLLSNKVTLLQKKWDNICHRLHRSIPPFPEPASSRSSSQVQPIVGFEFIKNGKENPDNCSNSGNTLSSPNENSSENSNSKNDIMVTKLLEKKSLENHRISANFVATDLGLGLFSSSKQNIAGYIDPRNSKLLYKALNERFGWQNEAISVISQTIARLLTRNERRGLGTVPRGDIWFNFLGPDAVGKKKVAFALAEILYKSGEDFINVDLNSQEGVNEHDKKYRGKTVIDYIAEELSKKQLSVIYLENVDKADLVVQNSLSRAIKTGKFADSYGREVSVNNAIIVTTSEFAKDTNKCSEERLFRAKGRPMQITLTSGGKIDLNKSITTKQDTSNPVFVNKRKLMGRNEILNLRENLEIAKRPHKVSNIYLDLNLPAENIDMDENDNDDDSKSWLRDFFAQVDETVVFKPFDFDALEEKISNKIDECFLKINGQECALEIDSTAMDEIVAASYLSGKFNGADEWIDHVLSKGFEEAKKRYNNLTSSHIMKLVACDDPFLEETEPYFPSRIIIN